MPPVFAYLEEGQLAGLALIAVGRWLRSDLDTAMRDSIELYTLAHTTGEAKRLVQERLAARRAATGEPGAPRS